MSFFRASSGRRGPNALGIESLVEDQALEDGFAVDEDLAPVDGDLAQAEVALQLVNLLFAAVERELEIVQERGVRLPEPLFLEVQHQLVLVGTGGRVGRHEFAVGERFRSERQVLVLAVDFRLD